jgi:hypothetical protein
VPQEPRGEDEDGDRVDGTHARARVPG